MKAGLDKNRIVLRFSYEHRTVKTVKAMPGARWNAKLQAWLLPLDLKSARILREAFPKVHVSDELRAWSKQAARMQHARRSAILRGNARLPVIDKLKPDLGAYLKPYQRADVAYMAKHSVINANQAGLGKTTEVVAAAMEAKLLHRPILIVSPVTSLDAVWKPTIEKWCRGALVFAGTTPAQRNRAMEQAQKICEAGEAAWVCCNPQSLVTVKMAWAASIRWGAIVVDEFHTYGLANPKSLLAQTLNTLIADRYWPLSGSPTGGVPLNLFSALQWVEPSAFSSRWAWASQWLDAETSHFGTKFGNIQPGREAEFYRHHAPWLMRRLKSEVAPELPPKTYRDVWVRMRAPQAKQYAKFAENAEIALSGRSMIATTKLAEWQRLKLIAFSSTVLDSEGRHMPTRHSPKLEALVANLDHHDRSPGLVFSQYSRVVELIHAELVRRGFKAELLTGKTKDRAGLVERFQNGEIEALCIVTKAAGVSITLDRADHVHVIDRTFNPDDQDQAEDRAHRISRVHNVTVYNYGTRGTIEEWIEEMNLGKAKVNTAILDEHRQQLLRR